MSVSVAHMSVRVGVAVCAAVCALAVSMAAGPSAREEGRVRVLNTVPKFRLIAQSGERFGSKELEGKVWIATFFFTKCAQTCPLQTAALAALQKDLATHPRRDDIRFVSISVDPDADTPDVLRAYAASHGADTTSWTFLTGAKEDIRSLGVDGFKLPIMGAAHSQSLILVDRARRARGHYDALDEKATAKLRRDLNIVLDDPPGPIAINKDLDRGKIDSTGTRAYVPWEIRDAPSMKDRAAAQQKTIGRFKVFHDFTFTDRFPSSGITFKNTVVDDAGRVYKGVHYDHGNGVAIADVDGDGLYDIYFTNQLTGNRLMRNLGGGKFADITEAAGGVALADRVSVTASFADLDNDGDPDLYVTAVRAGNSLFENVGGGKFRDITAASGLGHKGHSSSAVFFDYDKDGLVDLFLCNVGRYTTDTIGPGGYYVGFVDGFSGHLYPERSEQSILFKNKGALRFEDVSKQTGLAVTAWTGAASPIDANGDGWQDLYILSMQGHDEYYENSGGKAFIRKSREVFPRTPWGAMGIKSFDFDNDRDMDLFITDMHTDMVDDAEVATRFWYAEKLKMTESFDARFLGTDGNHVMGNAFYRNDGGGRFTEISDDIGAETYWPWGLSVGDLNADGYDDVFITGSMNYPYRYAINSVLLNNEGKELLDSEFLLGVEPRRDGRTATFWYRLDCPGADKDHYVCKENKGVYDVYGALGSRASVVFDLDRDGDLDVVTNDFNSEPMVLESNLTERAPGIRWLAVTLAGTKSNREGLGAVVTLKAGGRTYTKVMDGMSGYLSQSVQPLYFGLGNQAKVDEVEVVWPGSGRQVVAGPIETNRVLAIAEK